MDDARPPASRMRLRSPGEGELPIPRAIRHDHEVSDGRYLPPLLFT